MGPSVFSSKFTFILIVFFYSAAFAAEPSVVVINKPRNDRTYMYDLLKLALNYSTKNYQYTTNSETLTHPAQMEAVKDGELSLMWGGTSEQMEKDYLPVRIDGYRGVMSMRFLIIRTGDQARFDQVQSIQDLKSITFGQGAAWQDSDILEYAGLQVVRAVKKESLFHMLAGGRIDAFPRGATEAWDEVESHPQSNLTVEKHLVIYYPLPTYYFVHRGWPELAEDIYSGLEKAIADGNFDKYFYNNDRVKTFFENANLKERRVIKLENPFMPKQQGPMVAEKLQFSIDELIMSSEKAKSAN